MSHRRTRASLCYVATYLTATGIALAVAPQFTLRLLFSNGSYDSVFVCFSGLLMTGLGIVVIQLIRHNAVQLYPTTLLLRAFLWVAVAGLYLVTRDPFFLVVLAVVGAGMLWTGLSLWSERR
ncbi:MAG TPA: hypothetical protein VNN17_01125 [Terriglobia bacterium]|nr:hypothetical protein [Terriglobia bacterium]